MASLGKAGTLGGISNHGFGIDYDRIRPLTEVISVTTFLKYYHFFEVTVFICGPIH
jgi:hypothetical protein